LTQHYHISLEDLLVKYLLQEASPEERRSVDQWLAADPANRQHFDQLKLIWEKSLPPGRPVDSLGEEEKAWRLLREKMHQPRHRTPIHTLRWAAVATAAAAAILIFLWWRPTAASWQQVAAGNAIRIDTLADGSIVTLNKHSTLSTSAVNHRTVSLAGEAFFQISPDKDHPFKIHTNRLTITVLGTSFNIRNEHDTTVVTVETGLIEIRNRNSAVRVKAGETITLGQSDAVLKPRVTRPAVYNYYQPRTFVCHDTPLGELVDALNQAYGDSIVIENPALRQLPITTTFHDEPLPAVLDVIKKTLDITVAYTGPRYTLK
jgi:transmembrane sensor